jgi:hypothetical protein
LELPGENQSEIGATSSEVLLVAGEEIVAAQATESSMVLRPGSSWNLWVRECLSRSKTFSGVYDPAAFAYSKLPLHKDEPFAMMLLEALVPASNCALSTSTSPRKKI